MKSWILIVSYLWKDTWSRWLEQPSSVLARLSVSGLLVAVATMILVTLTLLERSVRARLESFGLNTLVVREMVSGSDPELLHNAERPDRLAALDDMGRKLRLRQLVLRAQTDWQNDLIVMSYPPEALAFLGPWMGPDTPLLCFSQQLPEDIRIPVQLQRSRGLAAVRRPAEILRPILTGNLLLVPQGWSPEAERIGFTETTLFQNERTDTSIESYVEAVNILYAADRRQMPQVQSALPLLKELEQLQERQKQWRAAMAGMLGLAMALVFGAIAVLEFRQNLYIGALLRSLGAPGRFLYFRQWMENALLANAAALAVVLLLAHFHTDLFGALGFSGAVLRTDLANPYWSSEIALIFVWVNIGAFLSSLPVALALRKPVGAVLN